MHDDATIITPPIADRFTDLHASEAAKAEAQACRLGSAAHAAGRRVMVVSACLLGEPTRYDGTAKRSQALIDDLASDPGIVVLPLCPELLGGMGCPRPAVHFAEGDGEALRQGQPARVVTADGTDCTAMLDRGAGRAEHLARLAGATEAVLKARSPSCGVGQIHGPDGLQDGHGALTARLLRRGLTVRTEEGTGP